MISENWKQLANDFTIEYVFVGMVNGNRNIMTVRNRKQNQLYYCISGEREYYTEDDRHLMNMRQGDLMLMPVGSSYKTRVLCREGSVGCGILFNLYDNERNEIVLGNMPERIIRDKNNVLLKQFEAMNKMMMAGGYSMLQLKARLYDMLYLLVSSLVNEQSDKDMQSIQPAVQYMETHLQSNVTIEELAQICGLSRSTFCRRFQQFCHASPIAWHLNNRMQKSRELLMSGMYSVEQVADIMGFCDTCYFSRLFHKLTGTYARDYRRREEYTENTEN